MLLKRGGGSQGRGLNINDVLIKSFLNYEFTNINNFNETFNTVFDKSISNVNGILTSGLLSQSPTPHLLFDGSSKYVNMGNVFNEYIVGPNGKFTINVLINPSNLVNGSNYTIISKLGDVTHGQNTRQFTLSLRDIGNGFITFVFGWFGITSGTIVRLINCTTLIEQNKLYDLTVTFDASKLTSNGLDAVDFFINEIEQGKVLNLANGAISPITSSTARLSIGAAIGSSGTTASYRYQGKMYSMKLFNDILNKEEIKVLNNYNKTLI